MTRRLAPLLLAAACALAAGADEIADRIAELASDDYAVREGAARRLVELGDAAVPALRTAAASDDPEVASRAEAALGCIAWTQALPRAFRERYPELPGAIINADEPNRVAWAQRISRECGREAVRPALLLLRDPSTVVRAAALMALINGADGLAEHRDLEALEGFLPLLTEAEGKVRVLAAKVAGFWGRKTGLEDEFAAAARRRLLPALVDAAGAAEEDVRSSAAQALGRIGDPAAVPALVALCEDGRAQVRLAAVAALAEVGDARGADAVARRLGDGNPDAVRAALDACRRLKAVKAVAEIRAMLRREGVVPGVRQAALEVLAALAPPALEEAKPLQADPDTGVRAAAWRIVLAAAPAEAAPAVHDPEPEVRLVAALALARGTRESAVPLLLELLDDTCTTTVRDAYRNDVARGEIRGEAMKSLEAVTGRREEAADPEAAAAAWKAWWAGQGK